MSTRLRRCAGLPCWLHLAHNPIARGIAQDDEVNRLKPAIGLWIDLREDAGHAARLGKQSGETLTILDGSEDEMSHVTEMMI